MTWLSDSCAWMGAREVTAAASASFAEALFRCTTRAQHHGRDAPNDTRRAAAGAHLAPGLGRALRRALGEFWRGCRAEVHALLGTHAGEGLPHGLRCPADGGKGSKIFGEASFSFFAASFLGKRGAPLCAAARAACEWLGRGPWPNATRSGVNAVSNAAAAPFGPAREQGGRTSGSFERSNLKLLIEDRGQVLSLYYGIGQLHAEEKKKKDAKRKGFVGYGSRRPRFQGCTAVDSAAEPANTASQPWRACGMRSAARRPSRTPPLCALELSASSATELQWVAMGSPS